MKSEVSNLILLPRAILALRGKDAASFLQGVCTQDVRNLKEGTLLYGAHLTPQGKFLFDFFMQQKDDKEIWLDVAEKEMMPFAQALHKYATGQQVDFHDLSADFKVYADLDSEHPEALPDPRHWSMGKRLYVTKEIIIETADTSFEDYERARIALTLPDGSVDGFKAKTLPAELNFDDINGTSYTKGCYVGQEVTARVQHRGKVKKKLVTLTLKEQMDQPPTPGTAITNTEDLEVGHLFSCVGNRGLGIIKTLQCSAGEELQVSSMPLTF